MNYLLAFMAVIVLGIFAYIILHDDFDDDFYNDFYDEQTW